MSSIVTAANIYGHISSFKQVFWLVTCYSSLLLSSKKTRKTKTRLEHIFIYFVFVLKFKTLILKLRSPQYLFSSFARQVLKTCGSLVETETPDDFKLFMEARR